MSPQISRFKGLTEKLGEVAYAVKCKGDDSRQRVRAYNDYGEQCPEQAGNCTDHVECHTGGPENPWGGNGAGSPKG